ncbi:hypothetical protein BGZ93_005224 [Podila epicladia]|nr:hypothetical protein BGZ92_009840 [Podila epicladia]KAG0095939.1 hypothetical protein BGZ93_005224 [Podila epicladia]
MSTSKPIRQFVPLPGQEYATAVAPIHKLPVDQYGKATMPTTAKELEAVSKPSVLISGGGIGGLTLALLLHKANIPFLVLERAKEIRSLGSAISMGSSVAPLFKQLGIWDEFVNRSKMYNAPVLLTRAPPLYSVGYFESIISRPDLYDLLFNSVPKERILLGKRVLSSVQNEDSVMVRCSDNTSYHGDILVGADGAYSAVRQNLYNSLKKDKKLPASDDVALPFNCVCLVGQTVPLDPEEFPELKGDTAQVHNILGVSTMCTWVTATTKQNTVCWMVIHFLDKESSKRNDSFRNSEWGSEATEALAREVRPFKVPGGKGGAVRTLGEYVDKTPKHLMSKVMLEEIVFDTWYSGRTVLLGDGGIQAIHDAVTLSNWLSTLSLAGENEVEEVFKEYRAERYPVAKAAFETSKMFTHSLGKTFLSVLVRGLIKRLPVWLWKRIVLKMYAARPQCSFLPLVDDNAPVKPLYQRSLHETLAIHKELAKNPAVVAAGNRAPVTI